VGVETSFICRPNEKKMNWARIFICGLVTGIVWTVLSAISTWFVGADFNAAVPGNRIFAPSAGLAAFLFAVNLAGGVWAMWLYAAIRPRYSAGAKTAAIAGFSWWIVSTLADATWGSFRLVPVSALLPLSAVSLPEMIAAAIVGAWLYRE
jgi:hypothetical protein